MDFLLRATVFLGYRCRLSSKAFNKVVRPELIYVWENIVEPFHDVGSGLMGERLYTERLAGHQISEADLSDTELDLLTRKKWTTVFV